MEATQIEHIEAYLEGKISREELEGRLSPEQIQGLEEDIEWVKNTRMAVEMAGLREQLLASLPQPGKKETKIRRLGGAPLWLAIAAGVAMLALIFFRMSGPKATPDLYAQYEYVDPGLPLLMSQSEDYLLFDAMTYYSEGNYRQTAEKLSLIRSSYDGNDTLSFYLGASRLYLGELKEAEAELKKVLDNEKSDFRERAEWLLVLTALKGKELERAGDYLKVILTKEDHSFLDDARQLERDISSKQTSK